MAGKASKPTFFWQGVLILLPLVIMTAIALAAIGQDRATVERETRRRAEEIAREFKLSLEQRCAAELSRLDALSIGSSTALSIRGRWPENTADAEQALTNYAALLGTWDADYPDLAITNCLLNYMDFTMDGAIRRPLGGDFPPQPALFWSEFSSSQREAWENLKRAEVEHASQAQIDDKVAAFVATRPATDAVINAQVIALRNRLPQMPPAEAVNQAVAFIASHNLTASSEAGIPLAALLMNDAVQCSHKIGPTEALWQGINYIVHLAPSFMTPRLLDDIADLAKGNPRLEESVDSMRAYYQSLEQLRPLAVAIQRSGKIQTQAAASFWIDHDDGRWFCTTMPMWINPTPSVSNQVAAVYLYPRSFVSEALRHSLRESLPLLPNYLEATVELNGESFVVSPPTQNPHPDAGPQLLAEASGQLTQTLHRPAGDKPVVGSPLGSTVDYEAMPSHPPFDVRISLINPAAMLAQHRQRALMLGGIVVASAFAAFVGFLAARRAFSRQLQLNEIKSNFVASVSHELRAPIASVRLMAESLERGKVSEAPKQNEYFRFIVQECRRLSSLIENVLDFSRIEQGRKQYEFEPTDLAALTQETVKLMEAYAAEKGVTLEATFAAPERSEAKNSAFRTPHSALEPFRIPHSELEVDGRTIQQALVNLMDNAIKHSPKGAVVKVGFECDGSFARLWVEDHGPGIPPEEHEKIFERFYRLGSELRRETQGVGIGLSIVRHIVEAHGGKVTVRSGVGQGSRFIIELPTNSLHK